MTKISPAGDITLAVLIFLEQLSGAVVLLAGGGGGCPGAEEVTKSHACTLLHCTAACLHMLSLAILIALLIAQCFP